MLLAVVALRYAEPVADGDLFWQMAYGRQLLERGTLVPDHAAFSWTPATGATIYCAWLGEIVLYGLGLPGLFILRYAIVGVALGLAAHFLRAAGLFSRLEFFPILLMIVLPGYLGTMLKPELFSFLFLNVLAWGYYYVWRLRGSRAFLWAFPLLMLVWVNTHGVFAFGLFAMTAAALFEGKAFRLSVVAAWVAILCTPYGPRYPLQLFGEWAAMLTGQLQAGDAAAYHYVAAHNSIFQAGALHLVEYGAFMALVVMLCVRDRASLLLNLFFAVLYLWYLRTSFYWAPFFFYSVAFARPPAPRKGVVAVAVVLFLGWSFRAGHDSVYRPLYSSWCGFGVSYRSPVLESEWVRRFAPPQRLVNDYDNGGYLLWDGHKVMIDGRSFPFREWLRPYIDWEGGRSPLPIDEADVAVISIKNGALWRTLLQTGKWQLAWFGPSAAVLTRPGRTFAPEARTFAPERFQQIRNDEKALEVFQFACDNGQYDSAWQIVDRVREPVIRRTMEAYRDSLLAYQQGDNAKALQLQQECQRLGRLWSEPLITRLRAAPPASSPGVATPR